MEKIIKIGGKEVKFKFTLSAFYIFKNQFSYDAMSKVIPAVGEILSSVDFSILTSKDGKDVEGGEFINMLGRTLESTYNFEVVDFLNLLWAFAKNADRSIQEPEIWFGEFDEFPIIDVMREFIPALLESLGSKKKSMKKTTEEIVVTKK